MYEHLSSDEMCRRPLQHYTVSSLNPAPLCAIETFEQGSRRVVSERVFLQVNSARLWGVYW